LIKLTTTLILLLIIYFSLSGLLIYRRLTKRLFNTLDLNPKIFSPTIHLERQLLRRIWMDTWTCLLLCHPAIKPPIVSPASNEEGGYFAGEFSGTAGERHLENIRIMRRVGYAKFYDSCKDLSQEEVLLRQKVYNLYSGPGTPSTLPGTQFLFCDRD
jgi:hypothetical protein